MVTKSPKAAPLRRGDAAQVGAVDHWFGITARGSSWGREIRGGLVTFFTMAYILALNPLIIGTAPDATGQLLGGLPYLDDAGQVIQANVGQAITMVAAATALIAGVMTIAMGVIGRFPIGIATGLGLNAVLAFVVAPQMTWPQAMGLVVIEGAIILVLVLSGFRTAVFRAVPRSLRAAISIGIGLFIAFVGLVDGGLVRKPAGSVPVELGIGGSLIGWPMLIFVIGLLTVAILYVRKVRGAILISILATTVVAILIELVTKTGARSDTHPTGWALNVPTLERAVSLPDLGLIGHVSVFGSFGATGGAVAKIIPLLLLVFALLLADFFDTMGTVVAVGAEANLLDDRGNPPHVGAIFAVDSIAAAAGGIGSVSSNTAYIESAAGVGEGARTGFASVITGICFLLAMFFAPLVDVVPSEAATPALLLVGFLMLSQVTKIDWNDVEEGLPAFLTIALMPFTFSITTGIGAGFVMFTVLKIARGKANRVHPLMWVVSGLFVIYFAQALLNYLVGSAG